MSRTGSRSAGRRPARSTGATPDLSVRLGGLRLANPVLTASGTFGYGDEYAHVVDLSQIGGVITKTVTVEPRVGNPPVRIAESAGGMLNSIGLENVGIAKFRSHKLPRLRALRATVIASIGGETPRELERLVEALGEEQGLAGLEINFSCPNVSRGGARYWAVPRRLERTMRRLRPLTRLPLIAKLSPDVTSVSDLAIACEQGGADAITAVNTFVGMSVDLEHGRHRLNRSSGGVSGPAIKPLALARCYEVARAVSIPVIGSGGIMTGLDALEFIAVGASAVQVGTASFMRPRAAAEVLEEMRTWLAAHGVKSLEAWRGSLVGVKADGAATPARKRGTAPSRRTIATGRLAAAGRSR